MGRGSETTSTLDRSIFLTYNGAGWPLNIISFTLDTYASTALNSVRYVATKFSKDSVKAI